MTEVIRLKLGDRLFKLVLCLSIFYMTIFFIAEVTAVSILVNFISGTDLWITASITIFTSLTYTLYGGLRASIFTDKIQLLVLIFLLFISFIFIYYLNSSNFNFNFILTKKPELLSLSNFINFTAGLTFFIAVAATNLFHQGNWQRVYAAKSFKILKKSLLFSSLIIIPIVFIFGFTGLVAISENTDINPDLAFFTLILTEKNNFLVPIIIFLGISLTISSIDTIINAISSLIVVDGKKIFNFKGDFLKLSKILIIFIALISFIIASKGMSILYLFLLADLFCCAAVVSIFSSFYIKFGNEKRIFYSIILGLLGGLLFFPSPSFDKSVLVGVIFPINFFPAFISQSLLFCSFLVATLLPVVFWRSKKP